MTKLLRRRNFSTEQAYVNAICRTETDAGPVFVHMELLRIRYRLTGSEYVALFVSLALRELPKPSISGYSLHFEQDGPDKIQQIRARIKRIIYRSGQDCREN